MPLVGSGAPTPESPAVSQSHRPAAEGPSDQQALAGVSEDEAVPRPKKTAAGLAAAASGRSSTEPNPGLCARVPLEHTAPLQ